MIPDRAIHHRIQELPQYRFVMLSRVAESIYWMSRYVERAENLARCIEVSINFSASHSGIHQWAPLVQATGDEALYAQKYGSFTRESVIRFLVFDQEYANSLISSISWARENARTIREAVSSESWEQLNDFYHFVKGGVAGGLSLEGSIEFFHRVKQHSHLFNGIIDATMSHNEGWHFANLGRHLERADQTSRVLDVKYFTLLPTIRDVNTTIDDLQWSALLRSLSGFEMYRKRFHAITIRRVAEFLIRDHEFPRSIRYCLSCALESLQAIMSRSRRKIECPAESQLRQLLVELDTISTEQIINHGMHEFIDGLQMQLNWIGRAINETYFQVSSPGIFVQAQMDHKT